MTDLALAAVKPAAVDRPQNPTELDQPAFLMNAPFSYATNAANNVWMEEIPADKRAPDGKKAMVQWLDLYQYLASESMVYLVPTPRGCGLQDLVFTANLGIVLEHMPDKNTVVISNFTSRPRRGEAEVGKSFFAAMGYEVHAPASRFEGEADLKHLYDNVYIGGYGQRSDRETYEWMERTFNMRIVKLKMVDKYLYHLDCTVFPLTAERTMICAELYEEDELAELESVTDIIDVSADDCYNGITNSVQFGNVILNASHLHTLEKGSNEYKEELAKNRRLEDIATEAAFEVNYFNLSEYHKAGALLSCMVMHLNRNSYQYGLL